MKDREYGKAGCVRFIDKDNTVKCLMDDETKPLSTCTSCDFFNGFRKRSFRESVHQSLFCICETEEQQKYDEAVEKGLCPHCGDKLVDNHIKSGAHKGHGPIGCARCNKVIIWV